MSWISSKAIPVNERLIVALDVPDIPAAKALVTQLADSVVFYKIGLELFMSGDYFELIDWLNEQNKRIFVDLKFFDVPATVGRAVKQLASKKVDFVTIHGNNAIMQAAAEQKGHLKVLAVTVLTSLDRGDLDDLGFDCNVEDLVASRAKRAMQLGCDGVISSGLEAPRLRESLGENLLIVSPGIRPVDNRPTDDQKRVVSVEQAFNNGADHIVVGRPIRDAENPKQAAMDIQASISAVFA
ncbi:orotidine 5'-phosphate decarboxylase [Cycloclasticus sp. 46_120_T64]|nr:orotidine 5'-phosphate decarboxylase [Cycloclasticus sp. 46_120_T64]